MDPTKLKWFSNKQFRQAIAHSIDKNSIINNLYNNLAYPQWSHISPAAGDFHNPDVPEYEYNPGKANEILDSIDYTDIDGDGIREDDQGETIEFTLITNQNTATRVDTGRLIRNSLQQIGITVDYQLLDFNDIITRITGTYDWDTVLIGYVTSPDPHTNISFWHSTGDDHLWNPNQS